MMPPGNPNNQKIPTRWIIPKTTGVEDGQVKFHSWRASSAAIALEQKLPANDVLYVRSKHSPSLLMGRNIGHLFRSMIPEVLHDRSPKSRSKKIMSETKQ
jgi:hypothetical protein